MLIYVPYSTDVYKEDKKGNRKLVASKVIRTSQIDLDQVDDITEYLNERGKIDHSKAVLIHRDLGTIVVELPVKDLWELREKSLRITIKGFNIEANDKNERTRPRKTNRAKDPAKGTPQRRQRTNPSR